MFRAQQNAFDEVVAKATDENLTSENWELILDVCDRVGSQESGPKDVVLAMIKRLAHRNANVQLYTLELANSLSQNCGRKLHQELASRSFTDALLRLASDRNTHHQVKTKILERMAEWAAMFSKDPDLGIMDQAYGRLRSQNPHLHPPSKPMKHQITDFDRQREEEELQMALALSVREKNVPPSGSADPDSRAELPSESKAETSDQSTPASGQESYGNEDTISMPVPPSQGTTAATVSRVRALYDFVPSEAGELQFHKGDIIAVLESVYKDWWKGSLKGETGIFPLNYVEKLADPTPDELRREADMEAEVFAEIRNVEKLLTLLSTGAPDVSGRDTDEVTELYNSMLAIRPKLIELIGKYSQKKDDFTQLNEKFIKARRDYESLLDASMAQPRSSSTYAAGPSSLTGPAYREPSRDPQRQDISPMQYAQHQLNHQQVPSQPQHFQYPQSPPATSYPQYDGMRQAPPPMHDLRHPQSQTASQIPNAEYPMPPELPTSSSMKNSQRSNLPHQTRPGSIPHGGQSQLQQQQLPYRLPQPSRQPPQEPLAPNRVNAPYPPSIPASSQSYSQSQSVNQLPPLISQPPPQHQQEQRPGQQDPLSTEPFTKPPLMHSEPQGIDPRHQRARPAENERIRHQPEQGGGSTMQNRASQDSDPYSSRGQQEYNTIDQQQHQHQQQKINHGFGDIVAKDPVGGNASPYDGKDYQPYRASSYSAHGPADTTTSQRMVDNDDPANYYR